MKQDLLFIDEFRLDGRKINEIRDIAINFDFLNVSGSAEFSLGDTTALAWVVGPQENRSRHSENKGILKVIFSIAPFASITRKKDYKRDLKMREFSKCLKDIFEEVIILDSYIKSEIVLNILIVNNDGGYKNAAINAASLALINAGIFIRDTVYSINFGIINEQIVLDLQLQEEKRENPSINIAFLPKSRKFIFLELEKPSIKFTETNKLFNVIENSCMILTEKIEVMLKSKLFPELFD